MARLLLVATAVTALRPSVTTPRRGAACVRNLLDAKGQQIVTAAPDDAQDHDVLLGELIFSSRDPRMDVATTPEQYGEAFQAFVTKKADDSEDMEERAALKSLVDMIQGTLKAVEEAEKQQAEAQERINVALEAEAMGVAPADAVVDTASVLGAAQVASGVDEYARMAAGGADDGPSEAGLRGDALKTYDALLADLLKADAGGDLASAVEGSFERCDFSLLNLAASRRDAGDRPDAQGLGRVIDAVNALSAKRLEQAAARLGSVLQAGEPAKMFAKITELSVMNQVDAPLIELLEANRQQAEAAGPAGAQAAELMKNLANRCRDEMDKRLAKDAPEKRLLRALLRSEDADTQRAILERAFEDKEALALGFGDEQKSSEGPEVEPPKFIATCQQMIADFGNIDDGGQPLAVRILAIASIAEEVATEIYGECASPREQQDRMWNEGTTSVFELEAAEMAAEAQGDTMPWHNDKYNAMLPDGFTANDAGEYIKKVGGG